MSKRIAREAGLLARVVRSAPQRHGLVALPDLRPGARTAERYLPDLVSALDRSLYGIRLESADDIVIRMTGCPNGCGAALSLPRSAWSAEGPAVTTSISALPLTARACPSFTRRISTTDGIVAGLDPIFCSLCRCKREKGERFGDFTIRRRFCRCNTGNGADFHANANAKQPLVAA